MLVFAYSEHSFWERVPVMSARKIGLSLAALILAGLAATGCGGKGDSSDGTSEAKAKVEAIASASANVEAKDAVKAQITACVNATPTVKLLKKAGRQEVIDCLAAQVPPAQRDALKTCVAQALVDDKAWTRDGREKFLNVSVGQCVVKVTGTATPTPSIAPSSTPSVTSSSR